MKFSDLHLSQYIKDSLNALSYVVATTIQELVISQFSERSDLIALAQTGSGKTGSFVIPILNNLEKEEPKGIEVLILCPTREIAQQTSVYIKKIDNENRYPVATLVGGVDVEIQLEDLKKDIRIVVATPGRLIDHLDRKSIHLDNIKDYILDEADQMLTLGFLPSLERLQKVLPKEKLTLLFSATMSEEVKALCKTMIPGAKKIELQQKDLISKNLKQELYYIEQDNKQLLLIEMLRKLSTDETAIVFAKMKTEADRLSDFLNQAGFEADRLHSDRSQYAREEIISRLQNKSLRLLVATDIAARGIDIDHITHIFNYDLPQNTDSFVHRIGRTARNGRPGKAITLCDPSEIKKLGEVQRLIKLQLPVINNHTFDNMYLKKALAKVTADNKKSKKGRNFRRR